MDNKICKDCNHPTSHTYDIYPFYHSRTVKEVHHCDKCKARRIVIKKTKDRKS